MSLRLLMIPFSILTTLILVIGFVKPDIVTLGEKQAAHAVKLEQAKSMDMLLGNIDALSAALENQDTAERFVQDYFPKKMDQERVIDMLNFLALQSGVAVNLMDLKEVDTNDAVMEEPLPVKNPLFANGAAADAAPVVVAKLPRVKSFSVRVVVNGRYENIRDFFNRAAHMNRIHKTRNFSIGTPKEGAPDDEDTDVSDILLGSFEADFDYFDVRTVGNALHEPVFAQDTFDMTSLDATSSWVTDRVPVLEKPSTGRPNPFR